MWRARYIVLACLFGFVALAGGIFIAARTADVVACERLGEAMRRESYSDIWNGCMVRLADGTFVTSDQYRLSNSEGR